MAVCLRTDRLLIVKQVGGGGEVRRGTEKRVTMLLIIYSLAILIYGVSPSVRYNQVASVVGCMFAGMRDYWSLSK